MATCSMDNSSRFIKKKDLLLRCPFPNHISLSSFSVDYLSSGAMNSMPNRSKSTPFSRVSLERIHILRKFHRKNQSRSKRNYWKHCSKGIYTVLSSSSLTSWDLLLKTFREDLAKFIPSLHSCGDFSLIAPAFLSQSTSPHVWHNNTADIWADLEADVYSICLTALAPGRKIYE